MAERRSKNHPSNRRAIAGSPAVTLVCVLQLSSGEENMSHKWTHVVTLTGFLSASIMMATQAQAAHETKTHTNKGVTTHEARTDDAIQNRIEHRLATDPS